MAILMKSVSDDGLQAMVLSYRRGMVNSLLEYLILNYLERGTLCGYDIIALLYDRFHVLLSPGQVYPVIDNMSLNGLISKEQSGRRVLLRISYLGSSLLKAWRNEFEIIQQQLANLSLHETSPM